MARWKLWAVLGVTLGLGLSALGLYRTFQPVSLPPLNPIESSGPEIGMSRQAEQGRDDAIQDIEADQLKYYECGDDVIVVDARGHEMFVEILQEEWGIEYTRVGCYEKPGWVAYIAEYNKIAEQAIEEKHGRSFDEVWDQAGKRAEVESSRTPLKPN